MSNLAEILDGDEPENPVITDEQAAEIKAEIEDKPTGEEESAPPAEEIKAESEGVEEESVEDKAFKAKALDETKKRQAIEAERDELKAQLEQSKKPEEKPDFWGDPDAALGSVESKFDQKLQQAKTDMSVELMRSLHDDYDDMETVFIDLAQQNPALLAQMNQSANPAGFAYKTAKQHSQMQEIGDVDQYKANLEAKIRAEIEAEMEGKKKAEIEEAIKTRSELPGSLSNERAAGGNTKPVFKEDTAEDLYDGE